jgi:hypothetical protein
MRPPFDILHTPKPKYFVFFQTTCVKCKALSGLVWLYWGFSLNQALTGVAPRVKKLFIECLFSFYKPLSLAKSNGVFL